MKTYQKNVDYISKELFLLLLIAGSLVRLFVMLRGHNWDVDSWRIVADIVSSGDNVYSSTTRYNYGPIWFNILGLLDRGFGWISDDLFRIRFAVSAFLTIVDALLACYLSSTYSRKVALLFFLNPISIIITGYHSQFDNLAILVGLVAISSYERAPLLKHKIMPLALLGLSLSIKHVLILFPVWMFFKEKRFARRILVLMIPLGIFFLLFIPYINEGASGIIANVFRYASFNNAPFWTVFAPNFMFMLLPEESYRLFFLGAIILLGFIMRNRSLRESSYIYLISFVALSSAVAGQYLAISIPGIAVNWNFIFGIYSFLGGLYLSISPDGLHLASFQYQIYGYYLLIPILATGLMYSLVGREESIRLLKSLKKRIVDILKQGI